MRGEIKPLEAICTSRTRKSNHSPQKMVNVSARMVCNCEDLRGVPKGSESNDFTSLAELNGFLYVFTLQFVALKRVNA